MLILLVIVFSVDTCRRVKFGTDEGDKAAIFISGIIIFLMFIRLLSDLNKVLGN